MASLSKYLIIFRSLKAGSDKKACDHGAADLYIMYAVIQDPTAMTTTGGGHHRDADDSNIGPDMLESAVVPARGSAGGMKIGRIVKSI